MKNRLKWARKLAWRVSIGIALFTFGFIVFAIIYAHDFIQLFGSYLPALKLIGLTVGPILAILGFFWGLVDKAELKDLAAELGEAKAQAEAERHEADLARAEFDRKEARIDSLQDDLKTIAVANGLWKLRANAPFPEYRGWKHDPEGAKIVTIGLFKGGVGKSHIAANFAAYVSETRQKPVLLIDLDYQGSLSTAMLTSAGIEPVGSGVDELLDENVDFAKLSRQTVHLAGRGPETVLNNGQGLPRTWLVPADYTLAEVESRLLVERVIIDSTKLDERYRLAHLLLNPSVRRNYGMIIIDTPPRMTIGTVNALVASHNYIVPTVLDRVSSEAVRPFLTQVNELTKDLDLSLQLGGIVASMTRLLNLSATEDRYFEQIRETAIEVLGTQADPMISQNLPRRVQITNNDDLGYFLQDSQGQPLREIFYDAIFDELWTRIISP